MLKQSAPRGQNPHQLDRQLNQHDPSPHVKRPALSQRVCTCGLPLFVSSRGLVLACGNGHLISAETGEQL